MRIRLTLKKIRIFAIGLLLVIIGGGAGYWIGTRDVSFATENNKPQYKITNKLAPAGKEEVDFSLFWDVWDQVHRSYLKPDEIDDKDLVYGAMKGMVAAVGDPYTVFLPPKEQERVKEDLSGQFEGVGIQLGYIDGQLAIMSPLEGMPAIKQGVQAGDFILNIKDDKKGIDINTIDMSLQEAVTHIRGPKRTPVTLTLFREGKGDFDVTIVRDTITVPSVEIEIGDWQGDEWVENSSGPVAWIKVYTFGDNTNNQWDQAVRRVLTNGQVRGVVLDVRNNGGGFFQVAIDLASEFIPDGVVVQQRGRKRTETYSVQQSGRLIGTPVVVLINKGTASASEILAGALRDRLGSKLVGVQSFGKGTVQDALELRGETGLHVTIAEWLLPEGDSIQEEGLTPDVIVEIEPLENTDDETQKPRDTQLETAVNELKSL